MTSHRLVGRRGVLLELDAATDAGADAGAGADAAALALAVRRLAADLAVPVDEVVPGARTVLVLAAAPDGLDRLIAALPGLAPPADIARDLPQVIELEVRYDGPDLTTVAVATDRSEQEVVRRHSSATYRAAFSGFAPGFAYLTGLDPALHLPRRDTPRPAVPAGSLAIADAYTAVYPRRSPGGWHLLGTVTTPVFDVQRDPAALLSPGCRVRFVETRG